MTDNQDNPQAGAAPDWSRLVRERPDLLGKSLALEPAGLFRPGVWSPDCSDCVFHSRREALGGGGLGQVRLFGRDGADAGLYWPGRDEALGAAEYLTSDDFVLAGTETSAMLLVGTSGQVTRACREAMLASRPEGIRPWALWETEAFWAGERSPVLHLVAAWRSRPGAPAGNRAAGAFAVEFELLRVLLAAYEREIRESARSAQAATRQAVRLHEVAWRCGDALASLTVAGALAADREIWREPLRAYGRIVESLAELPARLLGPSREPAEQVAAALAELLAQTEQAARDWPA